MKRYPFARKAAVGLLACLSALALFMDFRPDAVNRLDVYGFWGYAYKLASVLLSCAESRPLPFAIVWAALFLAYDRRLLAGQIGGAGEYLLSALLSGLMLLARAVKTGDFDSHGQGGSVAVLWSGADQLFKALIFFAGMSMMFLAALRWLNRLVRPDSAPGRPLKRPFFTPFLVLALVWLPQVVIRYPGVILWDTCYAMNMFVGLEPITAHETPFTTVYSGSMLLLGERLGNPTLGLFLMTLVQTVLALCVLARTICVAQRLGAPMGLVRGMLAAYCVLPVFIAFVTYISKDMLYTLGLLIIMTQSALLCAGERLAKPGKAAYVWLAAGGALAILARKNGLYVAGASMALLAALLLAKRASRRTGWAVAGTLAITLAVTQLVTGALTAHYQIAPGSVREVLSLPFQQTARVLAEAGDEVPPDEKEIIGRVLDVETIGGAYRPDLSDPVKNTYNENASSAQLLDYLALWLKHAARFPVIYLDAAVSLTRDLFDPAVTMTEVFEMTSYHNLNGWEVAAWYKESPFYMANQALTKAYEAMNAMLPFNLGFCTVLTLMLGYLLWKNGKKRSLCVWATAFLSVGVMLLSPVCATRYALPIFWGLPLLTALAARPARRA